MHVGGYSRRSAAKISEWAMQVKHGRHKESIPEALGKKGSTYRQEINEIHDVIDDFMAFEKDARRSIYFMKKHVRTEASRIAKHRARALESHARHTGSNVEELNVAQESIGLY